jgi:hypothetical protein
MATYLIGYDLHKSVKDYDDLITSIESSFPTRWHELDSTWIVRTDSTADEILERLKLHIHAGDELLVTKLVQKGAWVGFSEQATKWLNDNC